MSTITKTSSYYAIVVVQFITIYNRYAIDTVTGRSKEVYIEYPNNFKHIVQLQYNMREKTLFVWDNGRQMIFSIDFVY